MDMYEKSLKMFLDENKVEKENTLVVLKLPYQTYVPMVKLTNVISWTEQNCLFTGTNGNDFKFQEYYKVVEYFANYTKARMGLAMGVNNLVDIFDEKYYHLSGGILELLENYSSDMKVFLYPMLEKWNITTSKSKSTS
jgi:hypothetical protein